MGALRLGAAAVLSGPAAPELRRLGGLGWVLDDGGRVPVVTRRCDTAGRARALVCSHASRGHPRLGACDHGALRHTRLLPRRLVAPPFLPRRACSSCPVVGPRTVVCATSAWSRGAPLPRPAPQVLYCAVLALSLPPSLKVSVCEYVCVSFSFRKGMYVCMYVCRGRHTYECICRHTYVCMNAFGVIRMYAGGVIRMYVSVSPFLFLARPRLRARMLVRYINSPHRVLRLWRRSGRTYGHELP